MSEEFRRGIYDHSCVRCDKASLISDRVVLDNNDIGMTGEDSKGQQAGYLCEPCFEKEKRALYRAFREKKPLVNECCDLCGKGPQSRFLKDLACHVCDACQDDNDRSDEQIMSTMYTIDVQKAKFELPDEIIPGKLYLGSKNSTTNDEFLINGMNITQIIVCCGHLPAFFRDNQNLSTSVSEKLPNESDDTAAPHQKYAIRYLRLPVRDNLEQDLRPYLESAIEFINEGHEKYNGATLVHCHAGVSRSASVVIAWLMRNQNMDYDTAYRFLKEKRKVICPNSNFVEQLKSFS